MLARVAALALAAPALAATGGPKAGDEALGSQEYVELELYLMWRARDMARKRTPDTVLTTAR